MVKMSITCYKALNIFEFRIISERNFCLNEPQEILSSVVFFFFCLNQSAIVTITLL